MLGQATAIDLQVQDDMGLVLRCIDDMNGATFLLHKFRGCQLLGTRTELMAKMQAHRAAFQWQ